MYLIYITESTFFTADTWLLTLSQLPVYKNQVRKALKLTNPGVYIWPVCLKIFKPLLKVAF